MNNNLFQTASNGTLADNLPFAPSFAVPNIPEAVSSSLDIAHGATFQIAASSGENALLAGDVVTPYGASLSIGVPLTVKTDGEELAWTVSDEHLKILAGISQPVTFTYEVVRHTYRYQSSQLHLTLSGTLAPNLPAPTVPEAKDGVLLGEQRPVTLKVVAPSALKKGDVVEGYFNDRKLLVTKTVTEDGQEVKIDISSSIVSSAHGKTVSTYYIVKRGEKTYKSEELMLRVTVPEPKMAPPFVLVNGKETNFLPKDSIDVKIRVNQSRIRLQKGDIVYLGFFWASHAQYEVRHDGEDVTLVVPKSAYENPPAASEYYFYTPVERDGKTYSGEGSRVYID
ncbi:TPA: hypothetical protein QH957_002296 [Enterobacter bugandensis]|nr:hypothetical protein [Enterobacter bugandensis]